MDDMIIFSSSIQRHVQILALVFKKYIEAQVKVLLDKTDFLKEEIEFLGNVGTTKEIRPNPKKIEAIKLFLIPHTTSIM